LSKFIFAISTFYCLVNGTKAWIASFNFDFVSSSNYSNTAFWCFVVMSISFIFVWKSFEAKT